MSDKKILAIQASTRGSAWGKKVVGRLLDPLELGVVAGAGADCERGGGNHSRSSNTNFDQTGGSFNQNSGAPYEMNCTQSNPID